MFHVAISALGLGALVPGLMTALHLGSLATSSIFYRDRSVDWGRGQRVRFLVVVPAHNEELLLADTLKAIRSSVRPDDLVMVVDDRSTDRTGAIAEAHGAIVVRRDPGAEPGRAAARRAGVEAARAHEWDAMVMIDADSIIEPDFLDESERALAAGALAVQARSEAAEGERLVDQAALASFAMQGVMLPRGREVLGLPVRLRGTGMVLRREVVDRLDFRARASEDLQVSLDLLCAGVRTRHADRARLRSANARSWRVASAQKTRYEAGRVAAAREFVPALLAQRSVAALEAAWFLVSPPFAVAVGLLGFATGALLVASRHELVWLGVAGIGLLAWSLAVAAVQARLGPRLVAALAVAPVYVVWKLFVQARAFGTLRGEPKQFEPTTR